MVVDTAQAGVPAVGSHDSGHPASIVARLFEALNRQDLDGVEALFAPGYTLHVPGVPVAMDSAGFRQFAGTFFAALPDVHHTVEDQVVTAERAAARITVHGTHRGDFQGIVPTGRPVVLEAVNWFRLTGGRIVEHWISFDSASLLQQLGAR